MTCSQTRTSPAGDGDRAAFTALFRVAAGPRIGYGHLVRACTLAEAAGLAAAAVSVRGGTEAAGVARQLGLSLAAGSATAALTRVAPDVLIIDDPIVGRTVAWRRAARRRGVPIVSIHDVGLGVGDADLVVDGSLWRHQSGPQGRLLAGPRYVLLSRVRGQAPRRLPRGAPRVLVALGGGPRRLLALRLARAVTRVHARVRVTIAAGFGRGRPEGRPGSRIEWLERPAAFHEALRRSTVAIVAGGVTAYEACAAAVPAVALAVVPAQRHTVRALARAGAVLDGGGGTAAGWSASRIARVGRLAARLLGCPACAMRLAQSGARLIDGRGAARVAAAIGQLVRAAGPRTMTPERPKR